MEFIWDDLNDQEGNLYHILNRHPEMESSRFIETIFITRSNDEVFSKSIRKGETFLIVDKTYRRRSYRIVFQKVESKIRVKTAYRCNKRS